MGTQDTDLIALRHAVLTEISKHGGAASARDIVAIARNPASVIHNLFDWDDSEAAEKWREAQAEGLIRRLKINIVRLNAETKEIEIRPTREILSPPSDRTRGGRSYTTLEMAMGDDVKRQSLLTSILKQLQQLRRTYEMLTELGDVWNAIDDAALMFEKPQKSVSKRRGRSAPPPVA